MRIPLSQFGHPTRPFKVARETCRPTTGITRGGHGVWSVYRVQSVVDVFCYSPDGSKMTRVEGSEVVVSDVSTGFVQKTL